MLIHLVCAHVFEASQTAQPIKCATFKVPSAANPEEYIFGLGCTTCQAAVESGQEIGVIAVQTPFEHNAGVS